jgi:hypothetical protein
VTRIPRARVAGLLALAALTLAAASPAVANAQAAAEPVAATDPASAREAEAELLALHAALIEAHLEGDIDSWMAIEATAYVSVNGGRVSFPTVADRRSGRSAYLDSTTFEVYRDLRDPIVRVSEDGTLGWVIAEVEVRGETEAVDGGTTSFHDVWAWVELYERTPSGWVMAGNASNRRPPDG